MFMHVQAQNCMYICGEIILVSNKCSSIVECFIVLVYIVGFVLISTYGSSTQFCAYTCYLGCVDFWCSKRV